MGGRTFLVARNGMVEFSRVRSIMRGDGGSVDIELEFCSGSWNPFRLEVYDLAELRQHIRHGKFNARNLGGFFGGGNAAADSHGAEDNSELPALIFLVADGKGNVELRNAESFIASGAGEERASIVGAGVGVYRAPLFFGVRSRAGGSIENRS